MSALEALRAQLADVVAAPRPAGPAWGTGVEGIDEALGGGMPRGRITEVVGSMGAGKTTLLRETAARVLATGGWVAWIDARRTLAPHPLAGLGNRLVVVRPHDPRRGAWCADLLLRSGVFALVVLDGAPPVTRVQGVRLAGLARERDAALVVVGDGEAPSRLGGAFRLRVSRGVARGTREPRDARRHGLQLAPGGRHRPGSPNDIETAASDPRCDVAVRVERGKTHRTVEVNRAIVLARRLCTHPEIPDRRGVARGARRPWTPRGGHTTDEPRGITWGGIGAAVDDAGERVVASHAIGGDAAGPAAPRPGRERGNGGERRERGTRDWARYRGRRRAAETSYGRGRRGARGAREQHGAEGRTRGYERGHDREYAGTGARSPLGLAAPGVG